MYCTRRFPLFHDCVPVGDTQKRRQRGTDFGVDDVNIPLAAAGDTNLDGEMKFDDFLALSTNFGEAGTWEQGDFDGDGQVEFPDFLALSANFGGASPASASSVPEPTDSSIALFGLLGLIGLRKRG